MNAAEIPTLSITLLGAGQEVGRSCCVLQYRGRTIVCDAGVHPAFTGMASLPFVDELDWSTVDALLVTQYALLRFNEYKGTNYLCQLPSRSRGVVDVHFGEGAGGVDLSDYHHMYILC